MKPSKKTTTILNRSITYTQSWWGKGIAFALIVFLLASCEEDLYNLGFKKPDRFKVYYKEFNIPSSVLLMDSLQTLNTGISTETFRILAGQYQDPATGSLKATPFFQLRPTIVTTAIPSSAIYDSLVLQIKTDFYCYGSSGLTEEKFSLHEINEELFLTDLFYSNSQVEFNPNAIGTGILKVDKDFYKKEFEDTDKDSLIVLKIKLSDTYGKSLYDFVNPEDENFTNFSLFKNNFKGFALQSLSGGKVIGFSPNDLNSFLTLYYHDGTEKKQLKFAISQGINFNQFTPDFTNTELSGLNTYFKDAYPAMRYVQSGSSVSTKLDLTEFYNYFDTISTVIINSAELQILNVQPNSTLPPPQKLALGLLRDNNRYRNFKVKQDTTDFVNFGNYVTRGEQLYFYVSDDQFTQINLNYSSTDNKYNAYPTMFFQKLFENKQNKFTYLCLRPSDPQPGKSVNRVVFPGDGIKLKVYYTRPLLSNK